MKQRPRAAEVASADAPSHPRWLTQAAAETGRRWAERTRHRLLQDHRVPAGGWPGTLTEARTLASACITGQQAAAFVRDLSPDALDALARLVNASARRDWLRCAVQEMPEPPADDKD